MREVRPGVWHWEAPHPDWEPGAAWDQVVSSYAIEDAERLLLFDPLAAPPEIQQLGEGREAAIVLTVQWHARDTRILAERLGAPVYAPPPDEGTSDPVTGEVYRAGDRLPVGIEAFPGREPNDLVLWVEKQRAVVAGDTLIDRGAGLELPRDWLPAGVAPEQVIAGLRPLLELPVDVVLATHGGPADRAALERALS